MLYGNAASIYSWFTILEQRYQTKIKNISWVILGPFEMNSYETCVRHLTFFLFLVNGDIRGTWCVCYIVYSNSILLPYFSPFNEKNSEFKNSVLFPLKALFPEIFAFFDKMRYRFLWLNVLLFCWLLKVILYYAFIVQTWAFTWPLLHLLYSLQVPLSGGKWT